MTGFRWRLGTITALLAVGCLYFTFHHQQWGFDDAFIGYRFAANLVEGEGLVFNPGERVEGYSNLLYVLAMALGRAILPHDSIYGFSVAFNIACFCAALWIFGSRLRVELGGGRALAASALLGLAPPLWLAAWSGMETALVFLLFVAIWAELRRLEPGGEGAPLVRLAALLALAVLARADGFVMAGVVVAYLVFRGWQRAALVAGAAVLATVGVQLGFRLAYYGLPLPNTYYVKVTGDLLSRLGYAWGLFRGFFWIHAWLLAIAASVALAFARRESLRRALGFAPFFAAAWLAYWLYVGGDIFGMRFLLILAPLGAAELARLAPARWPRSAAPRVGLVAAFVLLLLLPFPRSELEWRRTRYDCWSELGRFLGERYPGTLIAVDGAGKIPYYSRLRAIDMFGLNDAHIAQLPARFADPGHSKLDVHYVLGRRPDLVAVRVRDPALNLYNGLSARRYRHAGYRVAYLAHLGPWPEGPPIVDVRDESPAERARLVARSYGYAVLAREGVEPIGSADPAGSDDTAF